MEFSQQLLSMDSLYSIGGNIDRILMRTLDERRNEFSAGPSTLQFQQSHEWKMEIEVIAG